jgi:hypothetical protein
VKPEFDIGLQWKIHHALQLAFLKHQDTLELTAFTFVDF